MFESTRIICWPDPRLTKMSKPVENFDGELRALAERMLVLMREARGVGLAAPQVGVNLRLFVMNPTHNAEDDRVYVNPVLLDAEGEQESEEGCLSLPGINVKVLRSNRICLAGYDLEGRPIEQAETGYLARIWQHEVDHLNGTLLLDRMGAVAKMANRRTIKEMETKYLEEQQKAKGKR